MPANPRRFRLIRDTDHTGVTGTGHVADGIAWPDGTATVRWRSDRASTVNWDSIGDAEAIHGHGGATRLEWIDAAWPVAPDPPKPCPHCPDGHREPASKPWNVLVHPGRDGDGQPTKLIVARPAGEHVAESDADWVYEVLRAAVGQLPSPQEPHRQEQRA